MKAILSNTADFIPKHVIDWFESEEREKDVTLIKFPSDDGGTGYINIVYEKNGVNEIPIFKAGAQGADIGYLEACGTLKFYGKKIIEYGTPRTS